MRTAGYVLVFCLLVLALCSLLALAAMQLSRLSSLFNQALLQQQQPQQLQSGVLSPQALPVSCRPSGQIWPASWQACQYQTGIELTADDKEIGFVLEARNINIPQGGGL